MSRRPELKWPSYSGDAVRKVNELVTAGEVFDYSGTGPVAELEGAFSTLHGGAMAVSFNSGTSALFAAFAALGLGNGDEVLVPNLTFLSSASPLLWLGATPVLVDSERSEPSICAEEVARLVTPRTRAVVVTHLFGNPVDIKGVQAVCSANGLKLIEDCSHAHASTYESQHVGTFGDAAVYSIGAKKVVTGGHGGVLVTRDPVLRDLALLIGHFKPRTRIDVRLPELAQYAEFALGGNLRLSPLSAILALDHLNCLDELSRIRDSNVAVLDSVFDGPLVRVRTRPPRTNGTHFDVVYRLPDDVPTSARNDLLDRLREAGVAATQPATRPLNRVLRRMGSGIPVGAEQTYLQRLITLSQSAPSDNEVPCSVRQHDRMISIPTGYLHVADSVEVREIARCAAPVLDGITESRTK